MTTDSTTRKDDGTAIMKLVEAIAISADEGRKVAAKYKEQVRAANPELPDAVILDIVLNEIVSRYAGLAAKTGGVTALAGIVPGIGTAVATTVGATSDAGLCMKFQADMSMCLAMAVSPELSNEDAKHLTLLIALACTVEELASTGAKKMGTSALTRLVNQHLKGAVLVAIKELFKQFGIQFAKKSLLKVIPYGVGVVIGAGANYWLTKKVGESAIGILRARAAEPGGLKAA